MSTAERIALVPGGARGIGRAIGLDLARAGWSVAFAYRTSADAAQETRDAIEAAGGRALPIRANVADPDAAAALVGEVEARWGPVAVLVHAAGPFHRVGLLDETVEGWRTMLDGNLSSLFYVARAVAPGMIARRWGRILAFGLATADQPAARPNLAAYQVAKAGVLLLVRSLARVLAPHGVTVNAISPGLVDSGGTPRADLDAMLPRIPAGRLGRVDDVVAVARFLLSEEADYVTGTNVHVSGGWGV